MVWTEKGTPTETFEMVAVEPTNVNGVIEIGGSGAVDKNVDVDRFLHESGRICGEVMDHFLIKDATRIGVRFFLFDDPGSNSKPIEFIDTTFAKSTSERLRSGLGDVKDVGLIFEGACLRS